MYKILLNQAEVSCFSGLSKLFSVINEGVIFIFEFQTVLAGGTMLMLIAKLILANVDNGKVTNNETC